jgi:hypothetical protein
MSITAPDIRLLWTFRLLTKRLGDFNRSTMGSGSLTSLPARNGEVPEVFLGESISVLRKNGGTHTPKQPDASPERCVWMSLVSPLPSFVFNEQI